MDEMSPSDLQLTVKEVKAHNKGSPLYERRATDVFSLVEEEEVEEIFEVVNVRLRHLNLSPFIQHRVMTYIVAKLGKIIFC